MASHAAAASVAGAILPNTTLSFSQSRLCHNPRRLRFPRRISSSALRIVRHHRLAHMLCAAQSAPPAEVEQREHQTSTNGAVGSSLDEAAPTLAQVLLRDYAESLTNGDDESLNRAKVQLQEIVDERDSLCQQVAALKADFDGGKDRFLRLNADFENFRRRSLQEKSALSDSVKADIIESLLPMIDSFERAKGAIKVETPGEERIDTSYQGIYKQFVEIMRSWGVSVVETVGKPFNPEVHEAIMREESEQYAEDVVSLEFRRGFKLGDKLLRPAMVKVSSGPGKSTPPPNSESASTAEAKPGSV